MDDQIEVDNSTSSSSSTNVVNVSIQTTEFTTGHLFNETSSDGYTLAQTDSAITKHMLNFTRLEDALPKTADTTVSLSTESFQSSSTSTQKPLDEFGPPEGIEYIFVPLGVMIFVIVLSAVVIYISRKRKMERLRHRLMPLYNFDPGEEGEDDWETELLDEGFSNRQRRQGYQSMDSEEGTDLFNTNHS